MALAGFNDRRQLRQQGKLNELQEMQYRKLLELQMAKELEMWEKTGYGAQKEQMMKAGLNPALMYGMSGGGGQTTGGTGSAPSAESAPSGGGEIGMAMGMALQNRMVAAQTKLIEAQAENVKTDTAKKAGVDSAVAASQAGLAGAQADEARGRIELLAQQTENEKLKWNMMTVQLGLDRLELKIKNDTSEATIESIKSQAAKLAEEAQQAMIQTKVDKDTQDAVISEIKGRAALVWAQQELAKSNIQLNDEQKKKIMQEIDHMMHDTVQGYNANILQQRIVDIMHYEAKIDAAFKPMQTVS